MPNEVITMYKDKSYTEALYPRTMASAVAWDETKTLPQYLNANLGFYGVDTSNLLANVKIIPGSIKAVEYTYVAPEDCYFMAINIKSNSGNGRPIKITINGYDLIDESSSNPFYQDAQTFLVPLMKNDTVYIYCHGNNSDAASCYFKVFGVRK